MNFVSYAEQKGIEKGIEKGREEGREEGIEKGQLLGQIRLCQELLNQSATPQAELLALPQEELSALLARLREQLSLNGR
jgi:flagellar biosynthesis/type III secretory pathway protein FliH